MRTEILYEDEDVLVIHKPAGLPTQTAKVGQPDAVSELKNYLAKKAAPRDNPIWGSFIVWISLWKDFWYSQRIKTQQRHLLLSFRRNRKG